MTEATLVADAPHDAPREAGREAGRELGRDTDQAAPRPENLPMVLESLLLVAEEPPTVQMLARVTGVSADAVEQALDQISADESRGIRLRRHGATIALVSAPEAAPWVEALLGLETPNRLSKAALETLAVIAYHQPVTRSSIERVRGVGAGGSLRTLRSRDLIEPVGRLESARPTAALGRDRALPRPLRPRRARRAAAARRPSGARPASDPAARRRRRRGRRGGRLTAHARGDLHPAPRADDD